MVLVKIGGGAGINLDGVAADLAGLDGPVVVVHGANAARDRLAAQLGLEKRVITSVSGYASVYSDEQAIDLLLMAYAGLQNKRIVECLQRHGRNAVGLTGLDGRVVAGTRNKGIRVREGDKTLLLRDFSGKPSSVNVSLLGLLLDHGYTPVLTVPLVDEQGCAINSENDEVVALLQGALQATQVIELIEAPGLLRDPADPASLIAEIEPSELARFEARADGRFKRKLLALGRLFHASSPTVVIADGRVAHPVLAALAGAGTRISARRSEAVARSSGVDGIANLEVRATPEEVGRVCSARAEGARVRATPEEAAGVGAVPEQDEAVRATPEEVEERP